MKGEALPFHHQPSIFALKSLGLSFIWLLLLTTLKLGNQRKRESVGLLCKARPGTLGDKWMSEGSNHMPTFEPSSLRLVVLPLDLSSYLSVPKALSLSQCAQRWRQCTQGLYSVISILTLWKLLKLICFLAQYKEKSRWMHIPMPSDMTVGSYVKTPEMTR